MKNKFSIAMTLAVVMAMLLTSLALADNVQNDVVSGGNDTITAGSSTVINYRITANNGDGQTGCNAADSSPATITINTPAGVTVDTSGTPGNQTTLTFTTCGTNQSATFASTTPGNYDITVSVSDAGTGTYNVNPAAFTLHVNAAPPPSDTTAPVITPSVNCNNPGNAPWCKGTITVSWSVTDAESAITSSSGCGTTTISTDTGASGTTLTCQATSAGGTNSQSVTVYRDGTAPTISGSISPAAAGTGWYNASTGAPTVSFTCGDTGGSGLASCTPASTLGNGADQSVTGTATDGAGNSASDTVSDIDVDLNAPTISASISPAASGTGWYNIATGAPTVTFTCGDTGGSGLTIDACPASHTFSEGAGQSYSASVSDLAGNSASDGVTGVNVDLTAPSIAASLSPASAPSGWYNLSTGAPTVSFSCSDGGSGLAVDACPASHTFGDGADQSYSASVSDLAGNTASDGVTGVDVDLTAPSITASLSPASPALSGWYNISTGAPTVSFSCSDGGSGLAVDACPASHTFVEGENQSYSQSISDMAGNSASAGVNNIDVDLTAPSVALVGGPAEGGSYYFGSVPAAPTCSASDGLSGLVGACNMSGYSAAVGSHTVTASASDNAGNSASASASYTVLAWTPNGFFQPVDMSGVWNTIKGGQTVPLKFEIFAGATELTNTSAVQSVQAYRIACTVGGGEDAIETVTTGATSLRYDATSGQFIFNWQTPRQPGTCYKVVMTAQDGSTITALFKLK